MWARFTDHDGTVWIVDPAHALVAKLEDIWNVPGTWPYQRPDEWNNFPTRVLVEHMIDSSKRNVVENRPVSVPERQPNEPESSYQWVVDFALLLMLLAGVSMASCTMGGTITRMLQPDSALAAAPVDAYRPRSSALIVVVPMDGGTFQLCREWRGQRRNDGGKTTTALECDDHSYQTSGYLFEDMTVLVSEGLDEMAPASNKP